MLTPNYDEVTRILESDNISIDPFAYSEKQLAELFLGLQGWMVWSKSAWDEDRDLLQYQIDRLRDQVKDIVMAKFMSEMSR